MKYITTIGEEQIEIEIKNEQEILIKGKSQEIDFRSVGGQPIYSMIFNGLSYEALVQQTEMGWEVLLQGHLYPIHVEDERERRLRESSGTVSVASGDFHLRSPMPGMVVDVPVEEGQEVANGDKLVILESMKMQNELKAPRKGTVSSVKVKAGDNVEQNEILIVLS
jgi:biotin carboxyl carrier protein